ncbi:MAG: MBL fold metallo-hydrolase [Clostridia bacterium]|nr:MBL fold metallo-hydrolase [Clostridia bacterium]
MSPQRSQSHTGRLFWRRLLGGLLAACLLLLLAAALSQGALDGLLPSMVKPQAGFALHMIDVGQGQALLLTCGGKAAMVDTGLPETSRQVTDYLLKQGVRQLDYLFITHPHSDHFGGARRVLETVGADVLIMPEYLSEEASLAAAGDWVGDTATRIAVTHAGERYTLGDAVITVLHPRAGNDIDDMNDLSLVLLVEYAGRRILLTGDLTENAEPLLPPIGPVDVLQVAHHGSYTSSTKAFLEEVRPTYALISCGKNNEYGHPHNVVIARLEEVDARIHRTDEEGTLLVRVIEGQIAVTRIN